MGDLRTSKNPGSLDPSMGDMWPDLTSLFPLPDSNSLPDDSTAWDESIPAYQTRADVTQYASPEKGSLLFHSVPHDAWWDDACSGPGQGPAGGQCYCNLCFQKVINTEAVSGEFETSGEDHSSMATDILDVFSVRTPTNNTHENWEALSEVPKAGSYGLSGSHNAVVPTSSNAKPRKRRRASPVKRVPDSDEIADLLGRAFHLEAIGDIESYNKTMRRLRELYGIRSDPASLSVKGKGRQISTPGTTKPPTVIGQCHSDVRLIVTKSMSLDSCQQQIAVSTATDPTLRRQASSCATAAAAEPSYHASHSVYNIFQCTYLGCNKGPWNARSDWMRHEQTVHWNNKRWMCKECDTYHTHPQGGFACDFCLFPFTSIAAVKGHVFYCEEARHAGNTFSRKDKLRDHLRKDHPLLEIEERQFTWVYEVKSDWPRQCGFCGVPLDLWELRADHIESEFRGGAKISEWRIPFVLKSRDRQSEDLGIDRNNNDDEDDDDEDDDNDNDFHDSMGGVVNSIPAYIASRPTGSQFMPHGTTWNYVENSGGPRARDSSYIDESLNYQDAESEAASTATLEPKTKKKVELNGHQSALQPSDKGLCDEMDCLTEKEKLANASALFLKAKALAEKPKTPRSTKLAGSTWGGESFSSSEATSSNVSRRNLATSDSLSSRLQYLSLDDSEDLQRPLFKTEGTPVASPPARISRSSIPRSVSHASTASTESLQSFSSSRKSSLSGAATSISVPNWHAPQMTFHPQMVATPYQYGYDLPCEFFFLGCDSRFNPANFEAWISHSASHFLNTPLPSKAICTFCDEATFDGHGNATINWRDRMLHIQEHLEDLTPPEHMRPDFWVIEHMRNYGLISPEDYAHTQQFTERPYCENLYPLDYETPDMLNKKERDSQERHDIWKEDRERRKEGKKGKSTHKTSRGCRRRKTIDFLHSVENKTPDASIESQSASQPLQVLEELRNECETEQKGKCIEKPEKAHCLECHLFGECTERAEQFRCLDCQVSALPHQRQDAINGTASEKLHESPRNTNGRSKSPTLDSQSAKTCENGAIIGSSYSHATEDSKTSSLSSFSVYVCSTVITGRADFRKQEKVPQERGIIRDIPGSGSCSAMQETALDSMSVLDDKTAAPIQLISKAPHKASRVSVSHSRGSSIDSRSSYETDGKYGTRSSRKQMYHSSSGSSLGFHSSSQSDIGCYGGSRDKLEETRKKRRYRVPDADHRQITSWTCGVIEVIDHRNRIYDPDAPLLSDSNSLHFKETRQR